MAPPEDKDDKRGGERRAAGGGGRRGRAASRRRPRTRSEASTADAPEAPPPLSPEAVEAKRDWLRRKFH